MKKSLLLFLLLGTFVNAQTSDKEKINQILDTWHKAVANVQFEEYFDAFAPDAIYIGTDATENWTITDFKIWAKPYFDKGKTWHFTPLERHVFIDKTGNIAWFDELLDNQMKICRGSGVLTEIKGKWKIQHYVLSMTIPNQDTTAVINIKSPIENVLIQNLQKK